MSSVCTYMPQACKMPINDSKTISNDSKMIANNCNLGRIGLKLTFAVLCFYFTVICWHFTCLCLGHVCAQRGHAQYSPRKKLLYFDLCFPRYSPFTQNFLKYLFFLGHPVHTHRGKVIKTESRLIPRMCLGRGK